ncbi:YybH family protein [Aquibaculum sediminis]|uniref:YybH family protein n=1 Tax=Aquibaculum sediminis TaxID=3231907 RepID=UPI0034528A5B
MDTTVTNLDLQADAERFVADCLQAINSSDLDAIAAHYDEAVVAFDAIGPLQISGREAYLAHWKTCMEMCSNMSFEPHHLSVQASGDLLMAHCLANCVGADAEGNPQSGWVRMSLAARKTPAGWRIIHDHFSLPFDPVSLKAQVEATP